MAITTEKSLFEQIEELRQEAESHQADADSKMNEVKEAMTHRNEVLAKLSEFLKEAAEEPLQLKEASANGTPALKKIGLTPKHGKGKPGRPKKVVAGKVAPTQRNYDNAMSLTEAIWDVLDRDTPATYKKVIPDYADDTVGLKVSEIKDIIEAEKKWQSSAENISPQIQQHVGNLRHEGKLARGENRRYFIVDSADLFGPPLDANGKPRKEGSDEGTYVGDDGKSVFTWLDGRVYKKRRKGSTEE